MNIKMAKCEDCGGEAFYMTWPAGWVQTGSSRWGHKYEEDGVAWYCYKCWEEREKK